eukprot:gene8797-8976_t
MAAATGDEALSRLFHNSNLLVGFRFPDFIPQHLAQQVQELLSHAQQQQQQQQEGIMQQATSSAIDQQQEPRVGKGMSPFEIVGGLLERPMPGPHIPQASLKALVELGTKLPLDQPLVLIGALYKRSDTPLAHLKQWVYGELLGALESPLHGVLAIEGHAQELIRMFVEIGVNGA